MPHVDISVPNPAAAALWKGVLWILKGIPKLALILVIFLVSLLFLHKAPMIFGYAIGRFFAGRRSAKHTRRTEMSTPNTSAVTPRAALIPLKGIVENANFGGLKLGDRWFNYGDTFQGQKPTKQAVVGMLVAATLVYSRADEDYFIRSIETIGQPPAELPAEMISIPLAKETPAPVVAPEPESVPAPAAPAESRPTPRTATPEDVENMEKAAANWNKTQLTKQHLDLLATIFFGKASRAELTRQEVYGHVMPLLRGVKQQKKTR